MSAERPPVQPVLPGIGLGETSVYDALHLEHPQLVVIAPAPDRGKVVKRVQVRPQSTHDWTSWADHSNPDR